MDQELQQQYTAAYGPLVKGDYKPGDLVKTRSGSGEVIWSYRDRQRRQLMYVISDNGDFPFEVPASGILQG